MARYKEAPEVERVMKLLYRWVKFRKYLVHQRSPGIATLRRFTLLSKTDTLDKDKTEAALLFGKFKFICRFENEAVLPPFKGSTFRGVFGRALKKTVCALRLMVCTDCLLKSRCLYALLFEEPEAQDKKSRMAAPAHPLVIEPPLTTETCFPAQSSFDFTLLLFGESNRNLAYFIYAFDQMGRIGLGRRINGQRGKYILEQVQSAGSVVYDSKSRKLTLPEVFTDRPFPKLGLELTDRVIRIQLKLVTPLRLKFQNRLQADLPFHILVRAMLRRVSALYEQFGGGEPALDYKGLVEQSQKVQIAESNLSWFDWHRYSMRQEQALLMGGLTGEVTYSGVTEAFVPLLELCEEFHVGKQTMFGLGKFQWERLP